MYNFFEGYLCKTSLIPELHKSERNKSRTSKSENLPLLFPSLPVRSNWTSDGLTAQNPNLATSDLPLWFVLSSLLNTLLIFWRDLVRIRIKTSICRSLFFFAKIVWLGKVANVDYIKWERDMYCGSR